MQFVRLVVGLMRLIITNMKILKIIQQAVPVIYMIVLIPFIKNDIMLALMDIIIIAMSLVVHKEKNDFIFLAFGLIALTISESFFIMTGVETFVRHSLFGIMPIWLPVLWAYAFVAIKRSIIILNK